VRLNGSWWVMDDGPSVYVKRQASLREAWRFLWSRPSAPNLQAENLGAAAHLDRIWIDFVTARFICCRCQDSIAGVSCKHLAVTTFILKQAVNHEIQF
jgi:hypothetical protein